MTTLILIALILLGISAFIGIVSAILIKPIFLKYNIERTEKENYMQIWKIECILSIVQVVLFVFSIICILISCIKGETLNDEGRKWVIFAILGLFLGAVFAFLYFFLVRKPFFKNMFPNIYDTYSKDTHQRGDIWLSVTLANFVCPITATLSFIGILIDVIGG